MKTLKLWNGEGLITCRNNSDPRWKDVEFNGSVKAFVAAYSRTDAARVIEEYCGRKPSDHELREYWSPLWGMQMAGIAPERGLWLMFSRTGKPDKVV